MGTSTGRLRDPAAGSVGDQMIGRSGDMCWGNDGTCFLNPTQNYIKLILTGYLRLYSEL